MRHYWLSPGLLRTHSLYSKDVKKYVKKVYKSTTLQQTARSKHGFQQKLALVSIHAVKNMNKFKELSSYKGFKQRKGKALVNCIVITAKYRVGWLAIIATLLPPKYNLEIIVSITTYFTRNCRQVRRGVTAVECEAVSENKIHYINIWCQSTLFNNYIKIIPSENVTIKAFKVMR